MFDQQWLRSECVKLSSHQTLEQFFQHLKYFAEQLACRQIIYTVQPEFYRHDESVPPPIMLTTYDGEWLDYYLNRTYSQQDAILEYCRPEHDAPYQFKSSSGLYGLTESDIQGMQDKGSSENGFVLPFKNGAAISVIVLVNEDKIEDKSTAKNSREALIEHFAYRFNQAMFKKFPCQFSPLDSPGLTPREREVILWLASGLGYEQIANRLVVGVSTVRKHVASVIKKLNARNSAHACALAVRRGLIY
ncbi:MAG: LuxR C-terminal-related transcriptional regulator [Bermanella sp.]